MRKENIKTKNILFKNAFYFTILLKQSFFCEHHSLQVKK